MAGLPDSAWLEGTIGAWVLLALAVYGLICALAQGADLLRRSRSLGLSVLVLIHDQEEQIEGLVRTLAESELLARADRIAGELMLVDLGSTDDTPLILGRLAAEYGCIRLIRLSHDQAPTGCEAGLFLCRNPVILLVDVRYRTDLRGVLRTIKLNW